MNAISETPAYSPAAIQKRLEWAAFTEMAMTCSGTPPSPRGWPRELADCMIDNGWWLEFSEPKPQHVADLAEVNDWLERLVTDDTDRRVLRARALAHPQTDSYVLSWVDIGRMIGLSRDGARLRHARALRALSDAILCEKIFADAE